MADARPKRIMMASTIAWIWGVFACLSGVALGVPAVAAGHNPLPAALLILIGLVFCWCGRGLRQARRAAGLTALILAGCLLAPFFMAGLPAPLVLDAAVFVSVALSWKQLS